MVHKICKLLFGFESKNVLGKAFYNYTNAMIGCCAAINERRVIVAREEYGRLGRAWLSAKCAAL